MKSHPNSLLYFVVRLLFLGLPRIKAGPAEELIDRLPGQPPVNFKQYGGYVTVDERAGRALFYYFAEAAGDSVSHSKPLTLWLNGGPGCSSIGGGAFTELGPFYPLGDGQGLRQNIHSWNKVSNLLFVESPAGVGWSYSNTTSDYTCGDESTAKDMVIFLAKWIKKFPEYASRDFFLTGESYAGHYIPQLAVKVLKYNEETNGYKFNLKGVLIGNPLLNINVDTATTYDYYWSHGLMSDESNIVLKKNCNFNKQFRGFDAINMSKECTDTINEVEIEVGNYVNRYDVIIDVCPTEIISQELRLRKKVTHMSLDVDVCVRCERYLYFNLPDVQKALHANITGLPYNWIGCTGILNYNEFDTNINILPVLMDIIKSGIRIWIYSGDQDSVIPLTGTRANVRKIARDLKMPRRLPYRAWYHNGQVAGWTTGYGKLLTYATVRGASHMVPYHQPGRAFDLFHSFISGEDLPTNP